MPPNVGHISIDPRNGCLVTNLSKLPSDKLNFGAGCPELILPLTIEKNSIAILAKKENFILRFAYQLHSLMLANSIREGSVLRAGLEPACLLPSEGS